MWDTFLATHIWGTRWDEVGEGRGGAHHFFEINEFAYSTELCREGIVVSKGRQQPDDFWAQQKRDSVSIFSFKCLTLLLPPKDRLLRRDALELGLYILPRRNGWSWSGGSGFKTPDLKLCPTVEKKGGPTKECNTRVVRLLAALVEVVARSGSEIFQLVLKTGFNGIAQLSLSPFLFFHPGIVEPPHTISCTL